MVVACASIVGLLLVMFAPAAQAVRNHRWLMYKQTNGSRVRNDVKRVDLHRTMSMLAERHSRAMARRGALFHTKNPASVYLKGVRWSAWGENVGMTPYGPFRMQKTFMRSSPHRTNILGTRFRHVAVGAIRSGGYLWVTVFFYG
jgi:uncharacterized protein YkwD